MHLKANIIGVMKDKINENVIQETMIRILLSLAILQGQQLAAVSMLQSKRQPHIGESFLLFLLLSINYLLCCNNTHLTLVAFSVNSDSILKMFKARCLLGEKDVKRN